MEDEIPLAEEYDLDDVILDEPPEVSIIVNRKEKKYWIRPPTESEKLMSQNAARRKARELRDLLENPETEEHDLLIKGGMENMSPEELRMIWLTSTLFQRSFELNRLSLENREDYFVPRPEGKAEGVIPPTNEEIDRYEKDVQKQEQQRVKDLQAQQKSLLNKLKKESEELDPNDLENVVVPLMVEQKVSEEWNNQYGMQILVRCTYLDKELSKKAFESTEKAAKLLNSKAGQKVLEALLNAHRGLMLDPDILKN